MAGDTALAFHKHVQDASRLGGHDVAAEAPRAPQLAWFNVDIRWDRQTGSLAKCTA
jgi:hypothetical protein